MHALKDGALLYQHTSRSGKRSFNRRMLLCTRPSALNASSPVGVFSSSGVCTTKYALRNRHIQSMKHEPNCQQTLRNACHHLGEEHHAVDAMGPGLGDRVEQAVPPAQPVYSWHGGDRDILLSIVNEDRQNEVCRRYTGL